VLNNIDWDSVHKPMMASGDSAQIRRVREQCGDRFIRVVFNQSRLFAVLHVTYQQNSSLNTLMGKLNGKADLDVLSASAELGGDSSVSSAYKSGAITVEVYSEGYSGPAVSLAILDITSADGLQSIATKLAAYLSDPKHDALGTPVKYQLAPLPDMSSGDLADARFLDYLEDLKSKFTSTSDRLKNVRALLTASDPRRELLVQPAADASLKQLQTKLGQYADKVSKAHDVCTKASGIDECEKAASGMGVAPPQLAVELPSLSPPFLTTFGFAIDGRFVPPGETPLLIPSTGTLFDAARKLKADATNIDLIQVVVYPYLSHVDFPVLVPNVVMPGAVQPPSNQIAGYQLLRAQDLSWPPYWKEPFSGFPIVVLHADAAHPCILTHESNLAVADVSCLTNVGKALVNVTLAQAAYHAMAKLPLETWVYLNATAVGCFPAPFPTYPLPSSLLHLFDHPGAGVNNEAIQDSLVLQPAMNSNIALMSSSEDHPMADWQTIAANRLAAIEAPPAGPGGPDPCLPHIK
jgi:hypothetical protein